MPKRLLTAVLLLLCATAALFADKRAFTIEDLYRLKGITDPRISPDGKRIVFIASEQDLKKGKSSSALYLIHIDGNGLRRLTFAEGAHGNPRWSPDGRTLLFTATRKDGQQIWLLPTDGGEARQLTKLSTGADSPVWTPDGKKILFTSDVYPECGADDAGNKKIQDGFDNGPLQAHMADRLLYRHWTSYADGKRTHILAVELEGGKITDLTPGDYDSPSFSVGGGGLFDVSPDGQEICFTSNREPSEADNTNKDLWLLPLAGGEPRNITAANKAYDGTPRYSPDGRFIAYLAQRVPVFEADRFRLCLYERATGKATELTAHLDAHVGDFQWTGDSRAIVFSVDERGRTPLYRVETGGGEPRKILDNIHLRAFHLAASGEWAALLRDSVGEPVELYRADLADGKLTRFTWLNKIVADEVDIRPAEEMWVKGAGGADVHVFIVKPHGFDPAKKYPLILNVHGGPQMMWADSFRGDWQVYPGAGYVVAFPNPHGSTGYGQAFCDAISRDWNGKVIEDIDKVADALAGLPYVDAERMGAMGWSWGGYAMMWLEGHSTRYKALAAMMGVYNLPAMHGATEELWFPEWDLGGLPWESPLYRAQNPCEFVRNFKTPCLVITGERDYRVPYTQSLQFFTDLQKMKVPSRLIVFKNDGHWPHGTKSMPFYYNAHLDWFHKYLGGAPAPWDMLKMWRNLAFDDGKEK